MTFKPDISRWPAASNLRRLLAVYLDYLIFSPTWSLAVWGISRAIPALEQVHPLMKLAGFLLAEALLLRGLRWSPGHELLGIRLRLSPEYIASRQESLFGGTLLVDPRLLRAEAWWTMLFGVLAILNGAKTAVRWTLFTPLALVFGVQLPESISPLVYLASGALECAVGAAALQMRSFVIPLAAAHYGISFISAYMSRDLWPQWIEAYTRARRAYQGLPVSEGQVEFMQKTIPLLTILPLVMLAWATAVYFRVRITGRSVVPDGRTN